jgi:hypothetical protein
MGIVDSAWNFGWCLYFVRIVDSEVAAETGGGQQQQQQQQQQTQHKQLQQQLDAVDVWCCLQQLMPAAALL